MSTALAQLVVRLVRSYGVAFRIALAQIGPLPGERLPEPPAIVRTRPGDAMASGFDPREDVGNGAILTVPYHDAAAATVDCPTAEPRWVRNN